MSKTLSAQQVSDILLNQKLSVLNDRASFVFPDGAVNVARSGGLMSAKPNEISETRIVLNIGKVRLVFLAVELYKIGDENLFKEVSKEKNQLGLHHVIIPNDDKLLTILSTPTVFDTTEEGAILINRLTVKSSDNSIFRIEAYANNKFIDKKIEFIDLTTRVFESFKKGKRLNNRNAHGELITTYWPKTFKFSLPANYSVTLSKGMDFDVIKLHKYTSYKDTTWVDAFIYLGNYPSLLYKHYEFDIKESKNIDGLFLGEKIQWMYFQDDKKNLWLQEQKIPVNNIEDGLIADVAIACNHKYLITEITKIIETIKLI